MSLCWGDYEYDPTDDADEIAEQMRKDSAADRGYHMKGDYIGYRGVAYRKGERYKTTSKDTSDRVAKHLGR